MTTALSQDKLRKFGPALARIHLHLRLGTARDRVMDSWSEQTAAEVTEKLRWHTLEHWKHSMYSTD